MSAAIPTWLPNGSVEVGSVVFDVLNSTAAPTGGLLLFKPPGLVDAYGTILEEFASANVVELGIFQGGSTAFFAQALRPRRLIACELAVARVSALDEFLAAHDMEGSVRLHYGTDQADRATLAELVDRDLAGEPIDLVIDDASHLYGPTVSSFETLFPRMRPGGLYLIEDWRPPYDFLDRFVEIAAGRPSDECDTLERNLALGLSDPQGEAVEYVSEWFVSSIVDPAAPEHEQLAAWYQAMLADESPACREIVGHLRPAIEAEPTGRRRSSDLVTMAAELVVAMSADRQGIADVRVTPYWLAIRRSDEPLDPASFRYDSLVFDHFGVLPGRHEHRAPSGADRLGGG